MQDFLVERPCRPLVTGEKRYYVALEQLPEPMQVAAAGRTKRCCVVNTAGDRYLEVPIKRDRKVLQSFTDMGSTGWVAKLRVFTELTSLRPR